MKQGWIKLHRVILDHPTACKDADYFSVWIYLLLEATHKEIETYFKGDKKTLKPGQLLTGRKSISSRFNISESKTQRILKAFENEQLIEQETSNQNRLITIVNWDRYQSTGTENEQQMNNERTASEQPVNTNKNVRTNNNIYITGREQVEAYQNKLKEEAIKIMKANGRWEKLQEDINSDQTLNRNIKVELKPNSEIGENPKEKIPTKEKTTERDIEMSDKNLVTKTDVSTMPKKQAGESMADYLPRYNAWFNQCKNNPKKEKEKDQDNILGFRRQA